ncbi:MAG TPA: hypothetical protein VEG62_00420, partial [Acidimicrobiales bacterium]|nr:hypothetical protein [Acidimicrobiales bacterium]
MAAEEVQGGRGAQDVGVSGDEAASGNRAVSAKAKPLGLLLTLVIAIVFVVAIGVLFHERTYKSPSGLQVARSVGTVTVNGVTMPHVTLHFATFPDSTGSVNGVAIHPHGNPSWPVYGMTNVFQVPAHALVTVTVNQYDSGGSLNNPWFATVRGTVGGVMRVDGRLVRSINPNATAHTFTVRAAPGVDPGFFLNVPLPAVGGTNQSDNGPHHTVVFSFISGNKGTYAWNCEYPCGTMVAGFGGPMGTWGYMSG